MLLAAGCGASTSNGSPTNGGSGGSVDVSGAGKSALGGQSPGGSGGGSGTQSSAGEATGGDGQGEQAQPKPTRIIVQADEEKDDNSSIGLWSFNVDGPSGVELYGTLTYGFSLSKKKDRVLINVTNAGAKVVLIDPDGKNRMDIPCPGALQARISPSGKYYAYPDDDGATTYQLFVAPTDGGPAKPLVTKTGVIEWAWDPDSDLLAYTAADNIEFYDVESAKSTNISDFGSSLGLAIAPDFNEVLYGVAQGETPLVRVWNRKTGMGVTVYEGVLPAGHVLWAEDSSAFMLTTLGFKDYPQGVLAADASGQSATFVPGAKGTYGYASPGTFLVQTASGSLEAWKLGAKQGVELFSDSSYLGVGEGFVAHCEQASGVVTLVNEDGTNRHSIDGTFECQAGMSRSGRYVAAVTKGFAKAIVFRDTLRPPEELPSPGATVSVRGSLRGGEGFTLDAPDGKSSWVYRPELEFILAKPSLPLFNIGGGELVP